MKNFAPSSKGFISLSFVFILTIFVSLYLTGTFAIALSQQRDYVRSTCIQEATEIQISTLKNVRRLFDLNSISTFLRNAIVIVEAAIAVATIALQAPLVAELKETLDALKETQKSFDTVQKGLLLEAQTELKLKHANLAIKINSGQGGIARPWRYMLSMSSIFTPKKLPTLPVRPDSKDDVFPNYEWDENPEAKLELAYSWNMWFRTIEKYQKFFAWNNALNFECSVAPDLKGEKWKLKINEGKSSQSMF
ncbi:hypothetical protein CIK05_13560 [Bdellovibrio sp. qaytius]|nr:hypothetical protein CIK05_13560 [Bdellovibrio sp. qaytius]